jgi:hypothetical protein
MNNPTFPQHVTCPFCGILDRVSFPLYGAGIPRIVYCDTEAGGCDQYYAVTATVQVIVEPTVHRIDGIGRVLPDPGARDEDGGAR